MFLFGCRVSLVKNSGFLNLVSFMSWSPQRRIPFHTGEVTPSSRHNATFPDQDQGAQDAGGAFICARNHPECREHFPMGWKWLVLLGRKTRKRSLLYHPGPESSSKSKRNIYVP